VEELSASQIGLCFIEFINLFFLSFQLIEIVGSVLDRPLIREEFTGKYDAILGMLDKELITAKV
jgi:hypothetical protein